MTGNDLKAVIFDLDGVLIDTAEFHKKSWYDLAEKEGFEMSDEFFNDTFGSQNSEIIPSLAGKELSGEKIRELGDWKEARYRELIDGKLQLLPGAEELIVNLKNASFKLAIGTSTPRENLDFLFERMPLHEYFDATVAGEEAQRSKPAPDPFLMAAEKVNISPSRCVVVEDAVQGVQAGLSGGMKVLAVTTTRKADDLAQADMVVHSLAEVGAVDFERLLA